MTFHKLVGRSTQGNGNFFRQRNVSVAKEMHVKFLKITKNANLKFSAKLNLKQLGNLKRNSKSLILC